MKKIFILVFLAIIIFVVIYFYRDNFGSSNDSLKKISFYDFKAEDINGDTINFSSYKGKVVLVVNTASKCGLTPQYKGLQELYEKYNDKGLEILGFPCNQFANQEPGDSQDIKSFCSKNYGVSFKMFNKINVNGKNTHPLYKFLKSEKKGLANTHTIKWNFTKFLINRSGKVVERYDPRIEPIRLIPEIEKHL